MRAFSTASAAVLGFALLGANSSQAAEFRTTQCAKHGHPEIVFEVQSPSIPDADRQWLVNGLEAMVASGSQFKRGETLQLGWMINRVEKGPNGTLRLQEPDMHSMPIAFVDSVDNTLRHVRSQKDTAESFTQQVSLIFPSLAQPLFVPPRYAEMASFVLERHPPEEGDSGWFMIAGTGTPSAEEIADYGRVSLYEFALARPDLIHLLALPPGTVIEVAENGGRAYSLDGKLLAVRPDSYLQQIDARHLDAKHH